MVALWRRARRGRTSTVEGNAGYALLKMGVTLALEGGYITEYDTVVGEKLANILSGGRLTRRAEGESSSICWTWSARRS